MISKAININLKNFTNQNEEQHYCLNTLPFGYAGNHKETIAYLQPFKYNISTTFIINKVKNEEMKSNPTELQSETVSLFRWCLNSPISNSMKYFSKLNAFCF